MIAAAPGGVLLPEKESRYCNTFMRSDQISLSHKRSTCTVHTDGHFRQKFSIDEVLREWDESVQFCCEERVMREDEERFSICVAEDEL